MPLFDDDELARMEQSLAGRAAAASGRRPGAAGIVLVLLALAAIGVVVVLAVRGRQPHPDPAPGAAVAAPGGSTRASEAASEALAAQRPTLQTEPPASLSAAAHERDAEAEAERRFEERRAQLAQTRPSQHEVPIPRRANERKQADAWWQRHAASIDALDTAAATVVHPGTTRIDNACADYVRTFEELLATDVRPAPTDGLATALQRYLFFHTNAVASCRAERYLDVQAQLATWERASRGLETAVAEALSQ